MQPPNQELVVRDLHENTWTFRHIYRGVHPLDIILQFHLATFLYLRSILARCLST